MRIYIGIIIALLFPLIAFYIYTLLLTYNLIIPKGKKSIYKGHKKANNIVIQNKLINLFERSRIVVKDGTILNAYKSKTQQSTHKWVICVHGYGGAPGNMAKYVEHFINGGFNVLLPELRDHNQSTAKLN
ncbi:hypothetical protein [Ruminococcus sp.]|uniref:hypothetical protein n=1 Tax=Ruminococcus sp. TaxID=41978 RepID=UPI002E75C32E|nr:hypothetical protein [Ruminococcus sp.]MEE1396889.1 hypothetical protein [Ruminococcus sp.]